MLGTDDDNDGGIRPDAPDRHELPAEGWLSLLFAKEGNGLNGMTAPDCHLGLPCV